MPQPSLHTRSRIVRSPEEGLTHCVTFLLVKDKLGDNG